MLQKSLSLGQLSTPRFRLDDSTSGHFRHSNAVLVPLDVDAAAEHGLPFAQLVAERWNAPLRLVHVRNPVEEAQKTDVRLIDNQDSLSAQTRAGAYLKDWADRLRESSDLSVTWETLAGGSVAETLRAISRTNVRAMVMVRTRRTLLSRFLWGSVTDRLIGRLAVPLLVVPVTSAGATSPTMASAVRFDRVLACVDGSDAAEKVVDNAIDIASDEAICHLLRVLPLTSWYSPGRGGVPKAVDLRVEAWRELFTAQAKFEKHGIMCKPQLVFDGQTTGRAIIDQARAMQASLIVVAARQYLLPWWLRDGVAEYVVRHASVPVLVVPANHDVHRPALDHVDFHSN